MRLCDAPAGGNWRRQLAGELLEGTETAMPTYCFFCQGFAPEPEPGSILPVCEVCTRRLRVGVIVTAIAFPLAVNLPVARRTTKLALSPWQLSALENLGEMLSDRGRLVRRHRQELREAEREMQAAGRAGYEDGREDRRGREE